MRNNLLRAALVALTVAYSSLAHAADPGTRIAAESLQIGAGVGLLTTSGYSTTGDLGAAHYKRDTSLTSCGFQSADGAFWTLAEPVINPAMCGAIPNDGLDDATAINAAIAYIESATLSPSHRNLYFPPGIWNVSSGFTLTKGYSVRGAGMNETNIVVAASVGASTDIFTWQPSNCFPEGSGFSFRGIRVTAASGTPGRHVITIDTSTSGRCARSFEIEYNWLGPLGGTPIATVNGIPNNPGIFDGAIRRNYINGGIQLLNAADSINIVENTITGANVGIEADLISGAANLRIVGNNITSAGGGVWLKRAAKTVIAQNYFEQLATWAGGSGNTALVDLAGSTGNLFGTSITGNQFSILAGFGGAGKRAIYVQAATDTFIDNNSYFLNDASTKGIEATASAIRTHFSLETNKLSGGSGTLQALAGGSNNTYLVVLAKDNTGWSHTGDTNAFTLWSKTLPGGMMGAHGELRLCATFSAVGTAGTRTWRVKLGGTTFEATGLGSTILASYQCYSILNQNSQSVQKSSGVGVGVGNTAAVTTGAVNTATDQTLLVECQLANSGDTCAMEGVTVEVIPMAAAF